MEKLESSLSEGFCLDKAKVISPEDFVRDVYGVCDDAVIAEFSNWSNWGNGPTDPGRYSS